MDKEKGPITFLKKLLSKEEQSDKKMGKYQYLLLVLLFGAGIMIFGNTFLKDNRSNDSLPVFKNSSEEKEEVPAFGKSQKEGNELIAAYERAYEAKVKEALDAIVGVDDATIIVNVDGTEKLVLEKNRSRKIQTTEETDREGGKRNIQDESLDEQLVITRNGNEEVPIEIETKKPEIRGVLVVASGADNITVKKWIIEAVTRVLDVPSHRVAVMPKKTKTKGDS